jgi:hypothetical protein
MPPPHSHPGPERLATVDTEFELAPITGGAQAQLAGAHLLRLCLDLQMHSLLLIMGAAAGEASTREPATASTASETPPWRQWVSEDIDVAIALAADTLSHGGALPSTLGSDLHRSVPATTVDSLIALQDSLTEQLTQLIRTEPPSDLPLTGLLEHCEHRRTQLAAYRHVSSPPRGITLPQADHHFLPGELLG